MSGTSDDAATTVLQDAGASRLRRRRRVLWLGSAVGVAVTVAGLVAAQFVRSPAQELADSAPPPRTTLTAPVEHRVLADTVAIRGHVGAGTTVEVTPTPGEAQRAVVTSVRVEQEATFEAGAALLEISGRPLFAMIGDVPAYRDLRPGVEGDDVTQLQETLVELGYEVGAVDGVFGPRVKAALRAFYEDAGYRAPTAGDPDALAQAEEAVRQAERSLVEAEQELERLREHPPSPAPGEADPVAEAERQVTYAEEDLAAAQETRDATQVRTGPMLPLSEVVFLPTFPARVDQRTAEVGMEIATSDSPLLTVSSGELLVRTRVDSAQRELLSEGMPVEIHSELDDIRATGEVAHIGAQEPDDSGARSHPVTVAPTDGPLDQQLAGADVRLTVQAATTEEEVLVVPLSAVFAGADSRSAVLRVGPDGDQERVAVSPGVSGDGYVAVDPIDGVLRSGDQVVVGGPGSAV